MDTFTIKNILVAYNSTAHSGNALNTAIAIAQQQCANVTLLHVVDNSSGIFFTKVGTITTPVANLVRLANENLNVLVKTLSSCHSISINYSVQVGVPAFEICKYVWENDIDLIVVGRRRKNVMKQYFVDSVYEKIVKNACCPVLSVPPEKLFTQFRKIVFPVRNAPLMLEKYSVVRPIVKQNNSSIVLAGLTMKSDSQNFIQVSSLTDLVMQKLKKEKVDFTVNVHFCDSIASRLLEITAEESPDLVVISTIVSSHFKTLFLEYYAKAIIHSAPCPVLSINPEAMAVESLAG